MAEDAWRAVRGEARHAGKTAHRAARGAPARVGEHEVGIGPAADETQQRLDVRRLDTRVFPYQLFELSELHCDGRREAQALHQ